MVQGVAIENGHIVDTNPATGAVIREFASATSYLDDEKLEKLGEALEPLYEEYQTGRLARRKPKEPLPPSYGYESEAAPLLDAAQ